MQLIKLTYNVQSSYFMMATRMYESRGRNRSDEEQDPVPKILTPQKDLVNKANLVHNLFLVYLFLVYFSVYTCFGRLCAHHQKKQLCNCVYATLGTCYSVWVTV